MIWQWSWLKHFKSEFVYYSEGKCSIVRWHYTRRKSKRFCNEWTAECLQWITNGLRCGSFRAIKIALGYRTGDNPVRKKQTRNELQVHTYAYVSGL